MNSQNTIALSPPQHQKACRGSNGEIAKQPGTGRTNLDQRERTRRAHIDNCELWRATVNQSKRPLVEYAANYMPFESEIIIDFCPRPPKKKVSLALSCFVLTLAQEVAKKSWCREDSAFAGFVTIRSFELLTHGGNREVFTRCNLFFRKRSPVIRAARGWFDRLVESGLRVAEKPSAFGYGAHVSVTIVRDSDLVEANGRIEFARSDVSAIGAFDQSGYAELWRQP